MRKALIKLAASCVLASFALFLGLRQSQNNEAAHEQPNERREDLVGRREWLFSQRAFPFKSIPNEAYTRAFEHKRKYLQPARQRADSIIDSPIWVSLGPDSLTYLQQPFSRSGRLTALAIDRNNSKIMFAGGSLGGVWKTIDGGNSWKPLTDFQPTLAIGSIAIDPANSNIIYVGTGDKNFHGFNYFGVGILKSTDGGESFTLTASDVFRGVSIGELAIDPTNSQVLYAAVSRGFAGAHAMVDPPMRAAAGVYKSVNGGMTWIRLAAAPVGDVMDIQIDPTNPQVVYAAYDFFSSPSPPAGIYRTRDGGERWELLGGTGFPTSGFARISFGVAPSSPKIIYAGLESTTFGGDLLNIYKSVDGGLSWTVVTKPTSGFGNPNVCSCNFTNIITVSPIDPNIVFFGGASLFRSMDGGLTWTDVTYLSQRNGSPVGTQGDILAIEYDPNNPNRVVIGSDGGVFASPDNGTIWLGLNGNLALTQFYYIASHPTDDNYLLGGSQDKGVLIRTNSNNWDYVRFGDGGDMQIDFNNPSTLYHPDIFMTFERSDDGGRTWLTKDTGLNKSDRSLFIMPVTMDPLNPHTLYLGSYRLYKTTDRADNWSVISNDLTKGISFPYNSNIRFSAISAIAVAKSSPMTIYYVGTSDGNLQITTNGGATFGNLNTGLPLRYISRIAIDPTNSQIAYVALSGFGSGHVFKTTNGGLNWFDISGNLPDIPANALVFDTSSMPNKLYVGTDIGVFVADANGNTWTEVGGNTLPNSPVFDLEFNNNTKTLFAATFGRGAFKLTMGRILPPGRSPIRRPMGDRRIETVPNDARLR